jgi:uncharacterized protein (DUF1697 family)
MTESDGAGDVHIALLRGINVGGKNKLPMKALAALFEAAGCGDVTTYIQSGNVVFRAPDGLAREVPARIHAAIQERHGLHVPVVTRTAAELRAIVRDHPFLAEGVDTKQLAVGFLADEPTAERVATLDPQRSPPDEFEVRGREIYLRFPDGVARSKLTNAYFDSRLATVCTVRNHRTVLALLQRVDAAS